MLNYISYFNARRLEKNKQWKPALEAYKKIVKNQKIIPAKILYRIGFVAEKLQDWKTAETWLSRAVELQADKAQWFYRLALSQEKNKKYENAIANYKNAIKISPSKYDWMKRLGYCYEILKKYSEALDLYQGLLETASDSHELYFKIGNCLSVMGEHSQAEEHLRKAISGNPRNAQYHHGLALVVKRQGRTWQEIEILQEAIDCNDRIAQWHFELGDALEKMDRYADAAKSFNTANRLHKNNPIWNYREGYSWEKSGRSLLAESAYKIACEYDKTLNSKNFGIGVFHEARGLWEAAAIAYDKSAKLYPFNGELQYRLGMAYDRCYRWRDAEVTYQLAISCNPKKSEWHYRLGFVLEKQKRYDASANAYEFAATTRSSHTPYWFYRLGYVLTQLGEYKDACVAFINTRIDHFSALELEKPVAAMQLAQTSRSAEYLKAIMSCMPIGFVDAIAVNSFDSAASYFRIGSEAESRRLWDEAVDAYFNAVMRSNTHNTTWYYRLGYSLFQCGRYKAATSAFIETRIFKQPHGVDMSQYTKDKGLLEVMEFTENMQTLQVDPNVVVYESFAGSSISCSPYAIYRYLINSTEFSSYTHVWVINDQKNIPEDCLGISNVIFVKRDTYLYRKYLSTAGWLINNSTFPTYFIRRKEQKYLNTWHGTPLKTLGRDMSGRFMEHKNGARNFLQSTHLLSPNAHTSTVMLESFDISNLFSGKFLESGYPRVDLTIATNCEVRDRLLRLFGLDDNKKIVLYAPTWRGTHLNINFDLDRLEKDIKLIEKSGYQVVFRGHSLLEDIIATSPLNLNIVPSDIDTNILLSVTDILITDYSSIFFDFISLRRPIIYYAFDKEEYFSDRGVYFDFDEMPGRVCTEINSLIAAVSTSDAWINEREIQGRYTEAIEKFCKYDDGYSSSKAVDFFFRNSNKDVVDFRAENNVLMFCGPFMGNGITSAAINLCKLMRDKGVKSTVVIDPHGVGNFSDREQRLVSLYGVSQIVARVGRTAFSVEEKWLNDQYMAGKIGTSEVKEFLTNLYRREFIRCFGETRPRSILNFEGYVKFWANLMVAGPAGVHKSIYQHNDLYSEYKMKYPYLKDIFHIYSDYDNVVSVSRAMAVENAEKIHNAFSIDVSNFTSSMNPIDSEIAVKKALGDVDSDILSWIDNTSGPIFLNVGRFSPEKRHDKLIDAFDLLRDAGVDARLIIVGDGVLKDCIVKRVAGSKYHESIFLAGQRMNPYPIFKISQCFVLSSDHEGQPITLLESLQLGVPAIATNIPSNAFVLRGGLGVLVENNSIALADAMKSFVEKSSPENTEFDAEKYQSDVWNQFCKIIH